jgi:hypothetical protein
MTKEELEKAARSVMNTAMKNMLESDNGKLAPVLIMSLGKALHIAPLDMRDKEELVESIPALINHVAPDAAFMVNDCLMRNPEPPHAVIGEVIMVFAKSYCGSLGVIARYTRDAQNKPIFGDVEVFEETTSGFFNNTFEVGNHTVH